jgi:hypothetical protein
MKDTSTDHADAIIRDLRILAEGCRTHPAYRARRRATGKCAPCVRLYEARLRLIELDGAIEGEGGTS